MDYKKIKEEFDEMEPSEQWRFVVDNSEKITMHLDSDNTDFTFDDDPELSEEDGDPTIFYLKDDIGNRRGLDHLLKLVGIEAHHV